MNFKLRGAAVELACLAGAIASTGASAANVGGERAAPTSPDLLEVSAPTITSSPSKAELEDVAVAATEFDLPLEMAVEQFGWRDNFGLLADEIASNFTADFARAEIVNGQTAWIAFAGEQPLDTKQLVGSFESAFPHVAVEIRSDVGYTATEMNEAVMAIHKSVMDRSEVTDAVTEFWSADNAILVTASTTSQGPRITKEALMAEFDLPEVDRLPGSVAIRLDIVEDVTLSADDSWSWHYGGEILSECTSGFGTRDSSSTSGTRGISTAGHCDNDLTDDGRTLTYQSGYDGYWGDFQWHTGAGFETVNFYSGNQWTLESNNRDVSAVAWASPGHWLCTNGKTTHKECDEVRNSGVCSGPNCNLFGMHNREQSGGDSGGPVFNGNTAYGLHEGGYNSGGGVWRDTKSQANYMPTSIFAWVATS